ncbi:P-loop NTPase family protein [Methylosarcina fibrata]|uniref:hypothetical protein n=1 Tax=Methylosarcina fibrata TaxID=105972 RepID=UPI0018DED504|nr:hypothetical protein [Methylosarcina fibrata]
MIRCHRIILFSAIQCFSDCSNNPFRLIAMAPGNQLRFAISDRINDDQVSPAHIPLILLGEFQKDVNDFLRGSSRDLDLSKVIVSIKEGSLAFVVSGLLSARSLWSDLEHLGFTQSLGSIDPKRAGVLARWQNAAQKNPDRCYSVSDPSDRVFFSIDSASSLHKTEESWVYVEKYVHGHIVDMGGSTRANVHLKLESGETLTIASTQELLAQGEQNRLYRPALLHVTAEENLHTGELRNLNLIAFEDYHPAYSENQFRLMVERGTLAWSNVPNSTEWVEKLRGNL